MKHILSLLLSLLATFSHAEDLPPMADKHLLLALNAIDNGDTTLAMGHVRVCINTLTRIHAHVSPEVSMVIDERMKTVVGTKLAAYLNVKSIEYMVHPEKGLRAEPLLKKAIELDPTLPESYNSLAFIEISKLSAVTTKIEWYVKAEFIVTLLDKAIELNPQYIDAYANRGYIYKAMKRTEEAQRDYLKRNALINNVPTKQSEK